jgi:hypothetical protein
MRTVTLGATRLEVSSIAYGTWQFGGDLDGTATLVANEGTTRPHVRVGERWEGYPPAGLTTTVLRTGQAALVEDYREVAGGERYLREGLRSAVATPIHVNGRLWD